MTDYESYTDGNYIPLEDCKNGHLYKISSRNLSYGVFNAKANGFIGIREKFGSRYLFTEFHWDTGEPYGTVRPREDLGTIPKGLLIKEELGTKDGITGKLIKWNKKPLKDFKWIFTKGGKVCEPCQPRSIENKPLFDYLERFNFKE